MSRAPRLDIVPPCPHCGSSFASVIKLAAHLRDDGGAGTRCPKLAPKNLPPGLAETNSVS